MLCLLRYRGRKVPKATHLVGEELQLSFRFHALFQSRTEGFKCQSALGLEEIIGDCAALLLEIGWSGLGFGDQVVDNPILSDGNRRGDLSDFQIEGGSELFAAANTGDGAVTGEFIRSFEVQAQSFGCRCELFALLDTFLEFIGLSS